MHPYRGWPFLTSPQHPDLSAAGAFLIHGCMSLLVVLPIVLRCRRRVLFGALAFLAGPALDLDHAIAAGSVRVHDLENLGHRPFVHSLGFVLVLALVALAVSRRPLVSWSVFAVTAIHLVFDACGGGEYWLFPLRHPDSLPWLAFPVALVTLTAASEAIARASPSLGSSSGAEQAPGSAHADQTRTQSTSIAAGN